MKNNLGNDLNSIISIAQRQLLESSELTKLTVDAYSNEIERIRSGQSELISINVPRAFDSCTNTPQFHNAHYSKQELIARYQWMMWQQLPRNQLLSLVSIIEILELDLAKSILRTYPKKLSGDKKIDFRSVVSATTIEEIHNHAIETYINDLSYESPKEEAEQWKRIFSIDLFQCNAFHKYVEIKATRDAVVHNRGFADETYFKKAGSHSRVKLRELLPVTLDYFFNAFITCIEVVEWIETQLHDVWPSTDYEFKMKAAAEGVVGAKDETGLLLARLAVKYGVGQ